MQAELQSYTKSYEHKPHEYFGCERPEMAGWVRPEQRRILDVGCGSGRFGVLLKANANREVWGVEPNAAAAAEAAKVLDRAVAGLFEEGVDLPEGYFDCVVFNDVLEHLPAPDGALRLAHRLLKQGGTVVASIPNIRHFPTQWRLCANGEWEYRDCGVLDRTHLRFFTRSSIQALFQETGFQIQHMEGINAYGGIPNVAGRVWAVYRLLNLLTLGRLRDMRFQQFAVVAVRGKE
jgi:2-polyprenyl-3-methyl-5-hydroxy-6-metoxy-1,4-benzoquinol methylase